MTAPAPHPAEVRLLRTELLIARLRSELAGRPTPCTSSGRRERAWAARALEALAGTCTTTEPPALIGDHT